MPWLNPDISNSSQKNILTNLLLFWQMVRRYQNNCEWASLLKLFTVANNSVLFKARPLVTYTLT